MLEEKAAEQAKEDGEVVYRRLPTAEESGKREPDRKKGGSRPSAVLRKLAPSLRPIVIGFALLLALVFLLGYLSARQLEDVSGGIFDLQGRQAMKVSTLLELRTALTKLDNEARARARVGEPEGTLQPPFALRLRNARDEVGNTLSRFDHLALAQTERGANFRQQLVSYLETTNDLNAYKQQQGYEKFKSVDDALDAILRDAIGPEQAEITRQTEELKQVAMRKVRLLWLVALFIGLLVAAASIREVQRRFREVRRSMDETRREREFSTQMLEGMVSAVAAIDAHDRIRSANSAFFTIFPRAAVGASVYDKFASPEALKMLEAATASRVAVASYRGRWTCDAGTPDCADKTFDVYSSPLQIDGEQGQIVTLVDVTEAVEAEAIVRKTESLTAMGQATAQVAHEIKNPLGSIRLGVSMLRDTATDTESQNTIDLVERGIHHLNKLVVDVTQFSRQKPLDRADVELRELIDGSLELVGERLQEKRTPIEKRFTTEALKGKWDEDQLRQVFVNLLANAVDASAEQSPITITTERVTVAASRKQGNRGNGGAGNTARLSMARLVIADLGEGMDETTRARIFEPFFTTKKRGTGLGLAISKKIVEQHGGSIAVESALGKGTRFIVDLPLETQQS
ncbi:MAG: two-component system, sporulation sensor kinase [Blastocatellia bacterium]|jgi:signal transduction histidine kinase|nr:two-component system, sporulation sensor kinase [Blastocatellia bacterium]